MITREPAFYREFHCLGGNCPLTCCRDWEIVLDANALADYANAPEDLRETIEESLFVNEEGEKCFRLTDRGFCPLFDSDGLCAIQRHWGEAHLCVHCGAYPRFIEEYGCLIERNLAISCPEAARLTMEHGVLPLLEWDDGGDDPPFPGVDGKMLDCMILSRRIAFQILSDSTHTLWERLAALLDYAADQQGYLNEQRYSTALSFVPRPICNGGNLSRLLKMAVRLLSLLAELEPLHPQWPIRLRHVRDVLAALPLSEYAALMEQFASARPLWELHLEHFAAALLFHHWPKAVNDGGLYGRVALIAAACVSMYHLTLLAWREGRNFSDADECLLWSQFSREVEHMEDNFFALVETLSDWDEWPLSDAFST